MSESLSTKLRIGTSGWSYQDWVGPFYPPGAAPQSYLPYYATHFGAVEVDSTFYSIPRRETVQGWADRTPDNFVFALKVPGVVTHGADNKAAGAERLRLEKVLRGGEGQLEKFLEVLEPLGGKIGLLLFQFPYFRVKEMQAGDFLERLDETLRRLKDRSPAMRFAVEIRNKTWIHREYLDLLQCHGAVAVMIDHPYMPRPREQLDLGMAGAGTAYVRLLGDRYAIEKKTKKWGEVVEEKSERLLEWAEVIKSIASRPQVRSIYAFSNNHFAGHAPATCRDLLRCLAEPLGP